MCSILGIFDLKQSASDLRPLALKMSKTMQHRGPDWSGVYTCENAVMVHERLAIVDPKSGKQPLTDKEENLILAVNGEIYNHKELKASLPEYPYKTESDCEVILPLYKEKGLSFLNDLNGMFAFALYDKKRDAFLIARDHIGIIPLYIGRDKFGNLYAASEMKALSGTCTSIREFKPGHYIYSPEGFEMKKWYKPEWRQYENVKNNKFGKKDLKNALEAAVHRQLMSDVPYGVLLSGGLDSSIISALAKKFSARRIETEDMQEAWWPRLHSFAIGLGDSKDLVAAKKVAEHIGTVHHEISYTLQEGLDALEDVIRHIETYDITTIRASVPMFLLARYIKSMGIKMVLSGEGADEIFGGYLYFHKAPDAEEFHKETVRKLEQLHNYDCLRANKTLAAWGVEGRVPFLDKEFLELAASLHPEKKMIKEGKIEKQILREAFEAYLPESVVWRQKEQFSDGVGYSWIDKLKDFTAERVSDKEMENAIYRFRVNTPQSKEEYYYRTIFEKYFPGDDAARCVPSQKSVACSTPEALAWDSSFHENADPSGRAVDFVHRNGYKLR